MATRLMFDGDVASDPELDPTAATLDPALTGAPRSDISLSLHHDLANIESVWRKFEEQADCTVFQTFDWLSAWQRNIGARNGVKPAIVIGRQHGGILFMLPLAVEPKGLARKVAWLGSYLCNYNGPLLAQDFAQRVTPAQFAGIWRDVKRLLRFHLRCDVIDLEKMPATIGGQANPLCGLRVTPHVNDGYLANLGSDWEGYYAAQRGAATRKTDRKRRKKLSEHGEVRFITAENPDDVVRTVDALIDEKRKAYAKLGVANMFDWPGYREFFLDFANNAQNRDLMHLSRFDVGPVTAAANYGLTFRGRYYYILAGYDDGELARHAPGTFQLQDLLRYAIERGFKQFDFTIGDEPYKREWCDAETRLYDHVAPTTLRGWVVAGPMVALRLVKRWVKRNPAVWSRVRTIRARLGALRG